MKYRLKLSRKQLKILGIVIIILALPFTLILVKSVQDQRSSAATPDKLEIESAVLNGKVAKLSDSAASGGQFVRLNNTASGPSPTNVPTSVPNPSIPSNAIYVPDSIDSTGSTDVSSQLKAFINNTPNGSTIVFKKSGTYLISEGMRVWGRSGITLEGNGATVKLTGNIHWSGSAILIESQSSNTTIRNFNILGNNPTSGTSSSCCAKEGQHGILMTGSSNTVIENMNISYVGGDCIYAAPFNDTIMNDGITVRNMSCSYTGRHCADLKGNTNVLVENSSCDKIGLHVFNFEMNKANHYATDIVIRNNTIGSYSHTGNFLGWLLAANGADGSMVKNVTFTGNSVKGGISGKNGDYRGLHVTVRAASKIRENFTITNNKCTTPVVGPAMRLEYVKGVTVTGNTQPLTSGSLVSYPGSTNVNISGNNTN